MKNWIYGPHAQTYCNEKHIDLPILLRKPFKLIIASLLINEPHQKLILNIYILQKLKKLIV